MIKAFVRNCLSSDFYSFLSDMYHYSMTLIFSILPINKRKIFVTNFHGNEYGDNGKYICIELNKLDKDIDIVWEVRKGLLNKNNFPNWIRTVEYSSLRAMYEMATSAVWIDNARKSYFFHKRKKQYYVQTWHGGPGVKKCEGDVEDSLTKHYIKCAKRDSKMCDLMVSNSTFVTDLFLRAFWYDKDILECGTPRNDVLCYDTKDIAKKVKSFYGVEDTKKILLYAPTFRRNDEIDVYDLDTNKILECLKSRFGGDWVAFIRLHPNIADLACKFESNGNVINVTSYHDMQELLAASDCLITDYSSSNIDFLLLKRPGFIYAKDPDTYAEDRGYYFDLDKLPFPFASSNEELCKNIEGFSYEEFISKAEEFSKKTNIFDRGIASNKVAKKILEVISKN